MAKKSAKQHKDSIKLDQEMKKMEEEALKAYKKDVEANADFTSQQLREILAEEGGDLGRNDTETQVKKESKNKKVLKTIPGQKSKCGQTSVPKEETPWYEGKSDGGYSYYWNKNTSESKWEEPEGGYISLKEQEKQAEIQVVAAQKEQETSEINKAQEVRAYQLRESMKNLKQVKEMREKQEEEERNRKELEKEVEGLLMGPQPRVDPYGGWTTVQRVEPKKIDLQLPHSKNASNNISYHTQMAEQVEEEERRPKLIIEEKRITSLGTSDEPNGAPIIFKKRKMANANFRRKDINESNEDGD